MVLMAINNRRYNIPTKLEGLITMFDKLKEEIDAIMELDLLETRSVKVERKSRM